MNSQMSGTGIGEPLVSFYDRQSFKELYLYSINNIGHLYFWLIKENIVIH
jgi:hypothetical protein